MGGCTWGPILTVPINGKVQLGGEAGFNFKGDFGGGLMLKGKF
jgi:hypothetical protein